MLLASPIFTMIRIRNALVLALLLLISMQEQQLAVTAFPSGAGGCDFGRAAVDESHLGAAVRITGPLANGGLEVVLDDEFVLQDSAISTMDFTFGVDHTLTLRTIEGGTLFRGFLFRFQESPNLGVLLGIVSILTQESLDNVYSDGRPTTSIADTQIAEQHCQFERGVGGLTHTNSNIKESVSAVLRMDEENFVNMDMPFNGMVLDVTAVIQNRNGVSEFYYSQFILNLVEGATGPAPRVTPTPTVRPTLPPTPVPTQAPVPTISRAPVPVVSDLDRKVAAAKCGSMAADNRYGGAAAQDKDCSSRISGGGGTRKRRRRKLKGSSK